MLCLSGQSQATAVYCVLRCLPGTWGWEQRGAGWGGEPQVASTPLYFRFLSFPSFSFLLSFSFHFFLSCQGPVMEPRLALHLQFPSMPGSHISSMDFQVTEEQPCLVVVDTLLSVWILMLLSSEMGFTRAHWYS